MSICASPGLVSATIPRATFCRRSVVGAVLAALACSALPGPAAAQQNYPTRPISIVVPYPPGSATDNVIRPLAAELQKFISQPIIVDNRAGANGLIGTAFVARAKPDGYTLLAGSSTSLAANVGLFKNLPYDPSKDFAPVAGLVDTSQAYVVRANSPITDLKSFVSYAQKQPNPPTLAYGSSSGQVAAAMLTSAAGIKVTQVPYKGPQQAIVDLIGGTIEMAVVDLGNVVPMIAAGQLRAIASTNTRRSPIVPDVPVLNEVYPGTDLVTWIGLVVPAGTPRQIVDQLNAAIGKALANPELRARYAGLSSDLSPMTADELGERMKRDRTRWVALIKAAGIEPQ